MSKIFLTILLVGCAQTQTGIIVSKQYTGVYQIQTDNGNILVDRVAFDTLLLGDTVRFFVLPHYSRIGVHSNRGYLAERGSIPPLSFPVD